MKKILLILCFSILLCGCGTGTSDNVIHDITSKELVEMMNEDALLIDVRTIEEFEQQHIENAINISLDAILNVGDNLTYEGEVISKDKKIIVYCQSGNRSRQAAEHLVGLGYKNIYDFGAMSNWQN